MKESRINTKTHIALDKSKYSENKVKASTSFFKKVVEPFDKGNGKFYIADLNKAIFALPKDLRRDVLHFLNNESFNKCNIYAAIYLLRTIRFRAIYDFEIINRIKRAKDYKENDPSIVLGFIKLYDDFSGCTYNDHISKDFRIADIEEILEVFPYYLYEVIVLHYGLIDGLQLSMKKVAKRLGYPLDICNSLKKDGLNLFKNHCC